MEPESSLPDPQGSQVDSILNLNLNLNQLNPFNVLTFCANIWATFHILKK
jgi:hypothetical protein